MKSIIDRVTTLDVLRLVAIVTPVRRSLMHCPLGTHPDRTPSFHAFRRGFYCFGCGAKGGILDLAVALGLALDRRHAAYVLEQHFSPGRGELHRPETSFEGGKSHHRTHGEYYPPKKPLKIT
jgi:hypothetical protein